MTWDGIGNQFFHPSEWESQEWDEMRSGISGN